VEQEVRSVGVGDDECHGLEMKSDTTSIKFICILYSHNHSRTPNAKLQFPTVPKPKSS
jgi:hypothetical protein